jgi:hypothetical protein
MKGFFAMKRTYTIICFLLFSASICLGDDNNTIKVKVTGIYSSMEYNKESGDLNGFEIFLLMAKGDYYVIFQISEGEPSIPIITKAEIKGKLISFIICFENNNNNSTKFTGKIYDNKIVGSFEGDDEKIVLIKKKSYWQ